MGKHQALEVAASKAETLQSELTASYAEGKQTADRAAKLGDALAQVRSEEAALRKAQEDSEAAVQRAWFLAAAEHDGREAEAAMAQALQAELAQAEAHAYVLDTELKTAHAKWTEDRNRLNDESTQVAHLNIEVQKAQASLLAESKACNAESECMAALTSQLQLLQGSGVRPEPAAEPAPAGAKKVDIQPIRGPTTRVWADIPVTTEPKADKSNQEAPAEAIVPSKHSIVSDNETPRTYSSRMLTRQRGGRGGRS